MSLSKIIKKVISYEKSINESEFDWVKEHEVTYDVSEMEVGKTYQFVPDLTLLDRTDVDEAPSFVKDYGKSKFYIIKQEPQKEYITFKPIGKAERMVHDGKYTRLPYQARVFQWGRFKTVENPSFEKPITESAFDWVDDIGVDPIHVGNYFRIDGSSTEYDDEWGEDDYIILKISSVSDSEVCYFTHKTNIEGEDEGHTECTECEHVKRLIDVEYWKPYDEKTGLFESEFDWTKDVRSPDDLANEISDKTVIEPNAFMGSPLLSVPFSKSRYSEPKWFQYHEFTEYMKDEHGVVNWKLVKDVWVRWQREVYSKMDQMGLPTDHKFLRESEFDWAEKVPTEEKISRWSGKHDGTKPNSNKTFIYTDENGKEHSVKVGSTAYKHRTRNHVGGYFGSDGEVGFYDSSITQDEIDGINNNPDNYDPFLNNYGVKLSRSEYNEYIRNGRLKYQMYDNFYPMNESEFEWTQLIQPLGVVKEGEVFFIVDSGEGGNRSNKDYLRYLFKLGGSYTEPNGVEYIKIQDADETSAEYGHLEYYREGDDLDISKLRWREPDDVMTVERVRELIRSGYWRPWSIRGQEVNTTHIKESEFDWTSDIGNSAEITMMNSFSIYVPSGFNQMEKLSKILIDQFPENGVGLTSDDWPIIGDLKHITDNGSASVWIEVDKEVSPDNSWSKTWLAMPGEETIPGSMNKSKEPTNPIVQAKDVVSSFDLINESDEFGWTSDIPTTLTQESDIEYFIKKPMYNIDVRDNLPMSADEGRVVELTYWIELNGEEPEAYNVCWDEYVDNGEQKVCTRFRAKSIVTTFNAGEFIFIDDYER